MQLAKLIKTNGLAKFYLELSFFEKHLFQDYAAPLSNQEQPVTQETEGLPVAYFQLNSPARLLWVTAANAIPQGHWGFAEKLLTQALALAKLEQMTCHLDQPQQTPSEIAADLAHIHANLAQLYADQAVAEPACRAKCLHHAKQTIQSGYFVNWAEQLCQEILQYSGS